MIQLCETLYWYDNLCVFMCESGTRAILRVLGTESTHNCVLKRVTAQVKESYEGLLAVLCQPNLCRDCPGALEEWPRTS